MPFRSSVAGLLSCLNHEDCVGANRYCHRNRTMTSGVCACNLGYKQARDSAVKCLSVGECVPEITWFRRRPDLGILPSVGCFYP